MRKKNVTHVNPGGCATRLWIQAPKCFVWSKHFQALLANVAVVRASLGKRRQDSWVFWLLVKYLFLIPSLLLQCIHAMPARSVPLLHHLWL